MMDHYYDKLLQIARFDAGVVKNAYLCQEASKAGQRIHSFHFSVKIFFPLFFS